ncbi:hypothetical protein [Thaumasiovibrio subtropicus]|uniref:hypothetical protein n=1 Tax=Thaumasiovibrio subtropicus TaxID=1891207 RepID=UPI000B362F10|nr:hypothetical protein [Thaumasiovibrio subtropicus]
MLKPLYCTFLVFVSFHSSSADYMKNNDGSLLIITESEQIEVADVFVSYPSNYTALVKLNLDHAILKFGHRDTEFLYTFSKHNAAQVDCIYYRDKLSQNGMGVRKAICNLNITLSDALENDFVYINQVPTAEDDFIFNPENSYEDGVQHLVYQDNSAEIYHSYKDLGDFLNGQFDLFLVDSKGVEVTYPDAIPVYQCQQQACAVVRLDNLTYAKQDERYITETLLHFQ